VAMRKLNQSIRVNFSDREFYFDIKGYKDKVYQTILDKISEHDDNDVINEKDFIVEYLFINGFNETLAELGFSSDVPLNIARLIKSYKFKSAIELIKPPHESVNTFLTICDDLMSISETYQDTRDNIGAIIAIRIIVKKYETFIKSCDDIKCIIDNFVEALSDLSLSANLKQFLDVDIILDYVNSKISGCSRLDTILRQTITILKESYNLGDPIIAFLLSDEDFLRKLKSHNHI
jgi:hypothetical protein